VDDHAQGSHTFADLLKGYTDFLALCERENWTLTPRKFLSDFHPLSSSVFMQTNMAPASRIKTLTPSSAWSLPLTYLSCG
jgi:hypothetical protein